MRLVFTLLIAILCTPFGLAAQEVHQELKETVTAEVTEIIANEERVIPGTETVVSTQDVEAKLLSGEQSGTIITFENEFQELAAGDVVYLNHIETINGDEYYVFKDYKRQTSLIVLSIVFVGVLVLFAGRQGIRALVSLGLSIAAILFLLVPALLAGYDPALTSLGIAGIILALVLFLTHGINPRSVIAFAGTFLAVSVTCAIAWVWVRMMHLTGFGNEVAVYLNFSTNGSLDFAGLLLGGIIIGILGVLDDVSITQASVTQELKRANAALTPISLYTRAIRVGRDHVGSLVNTLAFAYVGVSLPLILLLAQADASLALTLNQEIVAAELLRIMVGSIGLILAVPLTTAVAAWYYGAKEHVDDDHIAPHAHTHTH